MCSRLRRSIVAESRTAIGGAHAEISSGVGRLGRVAGEREEHVVEVGGLDRQAGDAVVVEAVEHAAQPATLPSLGTCRVSASASVVAVRVRRRRRGQPARRR